MLSTAGAPPRKGIGCHFEPSESFSISAAICGIEPGPELEKSNPSDSSDFSTSNAVFASFAGKSGLTISTSGAVQIVEIQVNSSSGLYLVPLSCIAGQIAKD